VRDKSVAVSLSSSLTRDKLGTGPRTLHTFALINQLVLPMSIPRGNHLAVPVPEGNRSDFTEPRVSRVLLIGQAPVNRDDGHVRLLHSEKEFSQ
jgi:hypothetical protein